MYLPFHICLQYAIQHLDTGQRLRKLAKEMHVELSGFNVEQESTNSTMKTSIFLLHFLKDLDLSTICCFDLVETPARSPSPLQITVRALLLLFISTSTCFPFDAAMHDLVPIFFMMTLLLTELTVALLPLGLPLPLGLRKQF